MSNSDIQHFVDEMALCECKKGDTFIKQGNQANFFYILNKGSVSQIVNGYIIKELERGACIGETALLYKKPRAATYKCSEDTELWYLDNFVFNKVLNNINIATTKEAN